MKTWKNVGVIIGIAIFAGWSMVSLTAKGATVNNQSEVDYWRFDTGGESQTIDLATENVPNENSLAYVKEGVKEVSREENSAVVEEKTRMYTTAEWIEEEWDPDQHKYIKIQEWRLKDEMMQEAGTKSLTYDILYDGNGILIEKAGNPKLYYATESPTAKEEKFSWRLLENTITVPVKTTYTYKRIRRLAGQTQLKYWSLTKNNIKNKPLAFWDNTKFLDGEKRENNNAQIYVDISGNIFNTLDGSGLLTGSGLLAGHSLLAGSGFLADSFMYTTKETITYTDEVEFYVLDTGYIMDGLKDTNIHLKSNTHTKRVTERYCFNEQKKQKLKVKYKKETGFTVTGLSKKKLYLRNNTAVRTDVLDTEQQILWKTRLMQGWNTTSQKTINEDIPIEDYQENGTTLYFMDANDPINIVSVKIPKIAKTPKLSLDVKANPVVKGLKPGQHQIRVWVPEVTSNGSVTVRYIKLPKEVGECTSQDGLWYDVANKTILVSLLANAINNDKDASKVPEMYIECRVKETEKKAASSIGTLFIREQDFLSDLMSPKDKIELAKGQIVICVADGSNPYEYCKEGETKWKVISKKTTKDAGIVAGTKIKMRKQSVVASDGIVLLPSTEVELMIPEGQNKITYTKADIEKLIKK